MLQYLLCNIIWICKFRFVQTKVSEPLGSKTWGQILSDYNEETLYENFIRNRCGNAILNCVNYQCDVQIQACTIDDPRVDRIYTL